MESASVRLDKGLQTARKLIEDGQFYEAEQMYKALLARYMAQRRYNDAKQLACAGALAMLHHEREEEGSELGLHVFKAMTGARTSFDDQSLELVRTIAEAFPSTSASGGRQKFLKEAVRWSATAGAGEQGSPTLHAFLARALSESGDLANAQRHYLRSDAPREFAESLWKWSLQGYPSERDLFLARAILQYLCLGRLREANIVHDVFTEKRGPSYNRTPLDNFSRFLLETARRDASPLFNLLRTRYKKCLDRDPMFHQYLDCIGEVFFRIPPASPGGLQGMVGDLL